MEECSAKDIYKIACGKTIPGNLEAEVWQSCLQTGQTKNSFHDFDEIFDLPEQELIRKDCQLLVGKISHINFPLFRVFTRFFF